jgi:ketosteroid isomerase-like protein
MHRTACVPARVLIAGLLACLGLAAADGNEPVAAVILDTDRAFAIEAADAGLLSAYQHYLDTEAILFRPRRVAAREWLETHEPASGHVDWTPGTALVACDRSLAVTMGTWAYQAEGASGEQGQYLTAWRPDATGEWRIVLDQAVAQSTGVVPAGDEPAAALPVATLRPPAVGTESSECVDDDGTLRDLLAADREFNSSVRKHGLEATLREAGTVRTLRDLAVSVESAVPVQTRAHRKQTGALDVEPETRGSIRGTAAADLALTHGEFVSRPQQQGDPSVVNAVYVRVWRRQDRHWHVALDMVTPVID